MLSVGVEFVDPPTHAQRVGVQYLVIKTMDRPNFNLKDYFQLTNDFMHNSETPVLVHWYRHLYSSASCSSPSFAYESSHGGISRSSTVVIAYLMKHHSMSVRQAKSLQHRWITFILTDKVCGGTQFWFRRTTAGV